MGPLKRLEQGLSLLRAIAQSDAVKDARDRVLQRLAEHASRVAQSDLVPRAVAAPAELIAELIGPPPAPSSSAYDRTQGEAAPQRDADPVPESGFRSSRPPAPRPSQPPMPGRTQPPAPRPSQPPVPRISQPPVPRISQPPSPQPEDRAQGEASASPPAVSTPAAAKRSRKKKSGGSRGVRGEKGGKTASAKGSQGSGGTSKGRGKKVRDKAGDLE
ncbi:MAG TPA: hypothetical protein PLI95_26235 [Polyangiaceae bacterium]|nr:hypothetical protein [Polyangiaceae bacterium]